MKEVPQVGHLIPEGEVVRRDAIHVAVAPADLDDAPPEYSPRLRSNPFSCAC